MKKTLYILAFIILLTTAIFVVDNYGNNRKSEAEQKVIKKVSVSQMIAGQDKKPISYGVDFGETALDLLKDTVAVETKGEGVDAYVTKINGRWADSAKKEFWAFYVNGKPAEVGAGSYKLKPGDKIEWRIETYK